MGFITASSCQKLQISAILALNVMEPACSNTVALVTLSCRAVPYCYHTKLLFSMLHSYREMILEWLLMVPGLGYGV